MSRFVEEHQEKRPAGSYEIIFRFKAEFKRIFRPGLRSEGKSNDSDSGKEEEGKTFHKLQILGMKDDLWDKVSALGLRTARVFQDMMYRVGP